MANEERLDILIQGVEDWNRWRQDTANVNPEPRETPFRKEDHAGVNLSGTMLQDADFFGANLDGAGLSRAHPNGVDCCRAMVI
jgi:uncharacterized protein YjbI with pentapeptide repeats